MRGVAQSISYEIRISIFVLCCFILLGGFSFFSFLSSFKVWSFFLFPPLFFLWVVTVLAETNRAPFDFAEGESELVSGFNVEYAAGSFAFIFMAEYANILIMGVLRACIFFPRGDTGGLSPIVNIAFSGALAVLVVWARAVLPRMRYDRLIILTWKSFLPFSLGLLYLLFVGVLVVI